MNKTDFVTAFADKHKLTQAEAARQVDAVLDLIAEEMAKGNEVRFTGFGTFEVLHQDARMGRNPRTGQEIPIPATKAPKFRPGATLKAAVRGAGENPSPSE